MTGRTIGWLVVNNGKLIENFEDTDTASFHLYRPWWAEHLSCLEAADPRIPLEYDSVIEGNGEGTDNEVDSLVVGRRAEIRVLW